MDLSMATSGKVSYSQNNVSNYTTQPHKTQHFYLLLGFSYRPTHTYGFYIQEFQQEPRLCQNTKIPIIPLKLLAKL